MTNDAITSPAAAQPRRAPWWLGAGAAAGLPFVIYLLTLVPTVADGDAADLARQCYTLGLAYPPGYPVVGMLGKVFTACFPFGPAGRRANLLAAVVAMATLLLGYALLRRWRVPALPAVLAMWVLGVLFLLDQWAVGGREIADCRLPISECRMGRWKGGRAKLPLSRSGRMARLGRSLALPPGSRNPQPAVRGGWWRGQRFAGSRWGGIRASRSASPSCRSSWW